MGSLHAQELASALASRTDKVSLRLHVSRLAASIKAATQSKDQSSVHFIKEGIVLLRRIDQRICCQQCFESMAAAVPYLSAHAEFDTAFEGAALMMGYASELQDKNLLRQAQNYKAIISKHLGDFPDAIIHTQEALVLARELGDTAAESLMLANLGLLLCEIGSYQAARACLERSLLIGQHTRNLEQRSNTFLNLAYAFQLMGKQGEAMEATERSVAEETEPQTIHQCYSRALREASYIYLTVAHGEMRSLKRHLEKCQFYAARSSTRPAECFYKIARALIMMRESQDARAMNLLNEALDEARYSGHPGLVEDALAALAWCHEVRGEYAEALRNVRSFIDQILTRRRRCLESAHLKSPSLEQSGADLVALKYRASKLEAAALKADFANQRWTMLERLATAASLRDDESGMHGYRVGRLAFLLASNLGWYPERCRRIEMAARLHDIGKSALPDHILFAATPLATAERNFIQSHPEIGASLLTDPSDEESRLAAEIALYHHEHWDGSGYPKRLSGAHIPISARIVGIADVFDALTHGRPYADPWSFEDACQHIGALSGTHFDPDLAASFLALVRQLKASHGNLDSHLQAGASASPFLLARKKIEAILRKDRAFTLA